MWEEAHGAGQRRGPRSLRPGSALSPPQLQRVAESLSLSKQKWADLHLLEGKIASQINSPQGPLQSEPSRCPGPGGE